MPSKDRSKYAPKSWLDHEYEFDLPSGDVCLLRKVGPLEMAEQGLMEKLDFATTVVMDTHAKNANMSNVDRVKRDRARREAKTKGQDPGAVTAEDEISMASIMKNAENSKAFRQVMDEVMVLVVVAPEMHLPPQDQSEERDDEWFYTDAVPFTDKMAIFNKVMEGVRSVETFREGSEETVGDVASEPSVRPATKRAPRPRKRPVS